MYLLSAYVGATSDAYILLQATDVASLGSYNGAGTDYGCSTSGKFRDPSAHCHLMFVADTANATAASRNLIYVNGAAATVTTSANGNWPINTTTNLNASGQTHRIGLYGGGGNALDGLLSEVHFIDGQALTPSSFGETNSDGVWVPKAYTGTYGTNGFHLDFKDAALTAGSNVGLGKDVSGNANYWTTNNISVTAGPFYDPSEDTPTNNYATLNPLDKDDGITSVTNANLTVATGGSNGSIKSSVVFPSGKWYWEVVSDTISGAGTQAVGIMPQTQPPTNNMSDAGKLGYALDVSFSDRKFDNGAATAYGTYTQANSTVYMFAFDQDNGKLWYGVTGSWLASGDPAAGTNASSSSISTSTSYCAACSDNTVGGTFTFNFGQRPFTYTPPTGFKSLCTANLPAVAIPNPRKHFDAKTRTGTGASFSVTGKAFQPSLVWTKGRSGATDHALYDAVRGVQKQLESNTTGAETTEATGLTAFNSDGYSGGALAQMNTNAATYIDWMWKANGAGVSNTSGSITSTVSANQTAGFSIVTYTGTGANATVGHGLGVAPKMVIVKQRSGANDWYVYTSTTGATNYLLLNSTVASSPSPSAAWNGTAPTSTVFSLGNGAGPNTNSGTYVAYCFAEVAGFSKFGSYTGNGSADGPFVYCGFRPRWILVKNITTAGGGWRMLDTSRSTYNVVGLGLVAQASDAETSGDTFCDITSNGFKIRMSTAAMNTNTDTYVFAAFAEHPFGGSNVSPSPAR
jgi:hypothetical protein